MRNWATFVADIDSRAYHSQTEDARRAVVELIVELVDDFIVPTQSVQTEALRGNPPGGTEYDIDEWVRRRPGSRKPAIEIIEPRFAELDEPSIEAIATILDDEGMTPHSPGTELCVYQVWVGTRAAEELGARLQTIEVEPGMRDTANAREDFRRLQAMLDKPIPRGPLGCLVTALFRLSPELASRELDAPHDPFVSTMLEFYAEFT